MKTRATTLPAFHRHGSTRRLKPQSLALLTALSATAALAAAGTPDLGPNARLNGKQVLPPTDSWNTRIDGEPVDPKSAAIIARIGAELPLRQDFGSNWEGRPFGIPYVVVGGTQRKVPIVITAYPEQSDPGPFPVPPDAPVEGGLKSDGDRHLLVVDRDNWRLYELFRAFPDGSGGWKADSTAVFDLGKTKDRPAGWTSADAAGLPIFPALVRYEEVAEQKEIRHALRFTVRRTRRAYVPPARHFASRLMDEDLPPMGMRVRLKKEYDVSRYPAHVQVILKALKTYGMILADNGGDWMISGAPDARWNDDEMGAIKRVKGKDLEVIRMGPMTTR